MNREQKAAAIAEIAANIEAAQAILAVDYRGISVPQIAELRAGLRDADASFKVVKNSLTERAADQSGAEVLKALLIGPTALAFVRGDVATAAKAIADYGRTSQLLPFKGGLMDGAALDVDQIRALSRLPSRQILYGQLVGVVASPVSGLVRSLGALLGGLAVALGQVREQREQGGETAAPESSTAEATEAAAPETEQTEPPAEQAEAQAPEVETAERPEAEAPAADAPQAEDEQAAEAETQEQVAEAEKAEQAEAPAGEAPEAQSAEQQAEPEGGPAQPQDDHQQADPEAAQQSAGDEAKPAKED
jgi:large subunit ribosomal protein L10